VVRGLGNSMSSIVDRFLTAIIVGGGMFVAWAFLDFWW
jgi:hypothetical protein